MKNFLRSLYLLSLTVICTLSANQAHAQLVVSAPPAGPNYTQLVQQFFVGGGVTVSNVTYTGSAVAVGSFTANSTNLGIPAGIILSTGHRNNAIGPNNQAGAGTNLATGGFADLNALAGATTFDGNMLQFDFVAQSTSVSFEYIFASEEYPEYVNQGYNDAFAFYIQGPGIPTWTNIALVPGTSTPITIDNVNSGSYSQYYVNNAGGATIQFDGFTTPMTATATVVPCQTYTLRLMIADGGDHIYDSAVFLEQGSLSSNAVTVSAGSGYSGSTNSAYEGCLPGYLNFSIPQAQATPYTFNYTIAGSAQNGVDYQTIPTSVTIPAGQTSAQIVITAINDGITEGAETIDVTVQNLCGTSTTTVYVNDVAPLTVNAGTDQTLCTNSPSATLTAVASGGLGTLTYSWSSGGNAASTTVTPNQGANTYTITVTDACPNTATDQIVVTANPQPSATFTTSSATTCTGANATITYTGTAIAGQTYTWNFNGGTIVSGSGAGPYQISWATAGTKTISLTVSANGCNATTTQNITVNQTPTAAFVTSANTVCNGQAVTATATTVAGGTYNWSVNNGASITGSGTSVGVSYPGPGTYTVSLNVTANGCTSSSVTNVITVNPQPTATFTATSPLCTGDNGTITYTGTPIGGATYTWGFNGGTVASGTNQGPYSVSWATAGTKTVTLTVAANGCSANTSVPVTVNPTPVAAFTVGSNSICDGQPATASATVIAGATYNWSVNNGASISGSGANVSITYPGPGTYTVSLNVVANACSSATAATQVITVKPQPTATFTATSPLCTGVSGNINYTGVQLTSATYTWGFNGATTSGTNQGPYTANWPTAGTKTVTLTVALNGCSASSSQSVVVNQTPTAAFTVGSASICDGQAATASATAVTGGTYNWSVNNGASISGSGANVSITYPGPGTYTVSLNVTANGCTSATTATNTITVKPQPTAGFTATSPLCTGVNGNINYTGVQLTGATYTWGFNGATTTGSNQGPYTANWATAGVKNVTLTVALNGCSASNTVPVTVNATPAAAFTVSSNSICDGQAVTATATTVAGATYNWSVNNGATITGSGAGPVTINYSGVGSYTVSLSTVANGCTSASPASNTITVKPQPTATFTAISPICTGVNDAITYTGNQLTGATYTWGFNGGTITTGTGAGPYGVNWSTAGSKNVTLTVALNGCSASTTVPVVVNQTPTSTFTASTPLCTGVNGTVNYSGTAISGATYNWNFDGGNVVSGANQGPYTVNWATAGIKNVSLTVTSNGCSSSSTVIPVTVKQTPASTFTADSPLCLNDNGTITYTGTQISGATYTWNFNGGTISSGSGVGPYEVRWATAGTKNVSLVVALNGCSSGATVVPVVVNAAPTAAFTLSGSTICDGQALSATYSGNATAGATYAWAINNGGTVVGSGTGPVTFTYPGPGTYAVSLVVTQNGCSSAANTVNVTVKPRPTSSFTTTSPLCTGVGGAITYTGTQITGATYAWGFNGGIAISGSGAGPYNVSWGTPGTKTVTLTVTANGCSSPVGSQTVTVNQMPSATFTAPTTLCTGANGSVNYTGTQLNGAVYTWNFDSANVVSGSNAGPYQVNWATNGVHPVVLSVSANGCTNTGTVNVNVNTTPVSSFTVSNTQFCTGAAATITYSGTPVSGATYSWNFNGGNVVSGSGMGPYQVTWATAGTKNITLSVTAAGCNSGTTTVPIVINSIPTSSFTASGTSVCDGTPVTLNYTGNGISGATFDWASSNGGTITGSSNPYTLNYPAAGSYNVSLTVTQNGCTSPASNVVVTVKPMPVADFDVNNTQYCAGANAGVTYTGSVIAGATYAWNFNGGTIASGSGAGPYQINWASAGTKTISLTVTAAGCVSQPVSEQVTVYQVPTSTFTASAPAVCDGAPVSINYAGNASANATYNWTVTNGGSITGSVGSFALNYPATGAYSISLNVSENGCSSTTTTVPVTVNPIPSSAFTVNNTQFCTGANATVTYTGPAVSNSTYSWNFNGGTVASGSGAGPYNVNWNTAGTKNITLTVTANGCPSSTTTVPVQINAIPSSTFVLSGNPVCDGTPVTISYTGTGSANATFNWTVNNGATIGGAGNGPFTLNYPGAGTYNVSLSVTENNCSSSAAAQQVVIKPVPTATFTANTPLCTDEINNITYTGTAPGNAIYQWNFDGATIVSGTGAGPYNVKWANGGTKNITLSVTQNGCTSQPVSVPVVINSRPTSTFTVSSPSVCMGSNVNLTYTGNGSPSATFNWTATNGATVVNNGGQYSLNYPGPGAYNISLSVSDNGCASPSTTTVPVTINVMPTSVFTASASPICTGETLTLTYGGNATGSATYTWSAPGLNITSAGNNTFNVGYTNAGTYDIGLTVTQNGCTSAATSVPVVINQTPTSAFVLSSNSVCNGHPIFAQYSGNGSSTATYDWSINNGATIVPTGNDTFDITYPGVGAYTLSLSVTENGCTSHSNTSAQFTVHEVPVSAFIAANSPVCDGEPIILNYTGTPLQSAVYTWYAPNGVQVNANGLNTYGVSYPGAGTYDVALRVTSNGCSSDTTHLSLLVKPTPAAPFDATPNVCVGINGYVTYNGITNPDYTYSWNFDGGVVSAGSNQGPYVVTWATPGDKDLTLVVTLDGCSSDTSHFTVGVNTTPVSDFTASSPLCTNIDGSIFYTGNAINGAVYDWNFDGATITSGSGMGPYQVNWNTPGPKLLTLTVEANGCTSTTTQQAVIVNETPTANFNALDTAVCMGEPITLLYAGNASASATFSWYATGGAGVTGSGNGPFTLDYTGAGTYYLTLTVTENGCASINPVTVPVTVTPLPQAFFTQPIGECLSANSYDFLAEGTFTPNATFSWGFPGSNSVASSSLINPSGVSYAAAGSYLVSLSVSDRGCNAAFIDSVVVYPDPVIAFSSDLFSGCEDLQVQFMENSGYGNDVAYLWNFGDGNTSTDPNPLHLYENPGVYDVALQINFSSACGSSYSNGGMVTVYPKPEAGFSATPLVTDMLAPTVTITNTATGITSCIYDMADGNTIDSTLNPSYTYRNPGVYVVTQYVTNSYGCTDTAWVQLRIDPYHTLYIPNAFTPNNDGTNDSFGAKGIMVDNFKMYIFNRWGELIFTGENIDDYWDGRDGSGKISPLDVYVYKIYYTLPDGSEQKQIGSVALVD